MSDPRLDRINALLDGDTTTPPASPEDRALLEIGQRLDDAIRRDVQPPASIPWSPPAARSKRRDNWIRAAVYTAAAAVVGIIVWYQTTPTPIAPRYTEPTIAYRSLVNDGFKPRWVCSLEEIPERLGAELGHPIRVVAALPDNVELLGWRGPGYGDPQILSKAERVMLARADGEPIIVIVVDEDEARDLPPHPPGLHRFTDQHGDLQFVEISPFAQPRILPVFLDP